ncbi:palmitoyltransferase akr1 [Entomortierella lignicola]|nr:palmitoyltransferase akr1 [Entomortierella lignicola]
MTSTHDSTVGDTNHVSIPIADSSNANTSSNVNSTLEPTTNVESTPDVNPHFRPAPNSEEDLEDISIFQAAQMGKLAVVARLIDLDPALVKSRDFQDVTALHWAAINNQIPVAKCLLDHGAEVDAIGGELAATPLHWCSRNGHLNMSKLLIKYGADPLLQDSQGFNGLHLATHSSNAMLILYLMMAKDMAVDIVDTLGHTSLMWAAYQGDNLSVEILLKHGARVDTKDREGFTPLHWAVVRGNRECLSKILMAGADVRAKDKSGKTPEDMIKELKGTMIWEKALSDAKLSNDGQSRRSLFEKKTCNTIIYFIPYVTMYITLELMVLFPWFVAIPLAIAQFLLGHIGAIKFILRTKTPGDMLQTPYYTAVFQSTAFLVGYTWIRRLLFNTSHLALLNLVFALGYSSTMYFFYGAVMADPGWTKPNTSIESQRNTVVQMADRGLLDIRHFCVSCVSQRPMRSKHCRFCKRCVTKFDHHCPWIHNCIGAKNHRAFIFFLIIFIISVPVYAYLSFEYLYIMSPKYVPVESNICLLGETLCGYFQYDAFTTTLAIVALLQMTWPGLLLIVQLYQVGQAKTTNEALNHQRHSYLGKSMNIRQRILRTLTEIDSEIAGSSSLQEESINLLEAGGAAEDEDEATLFSREEESKPVGFGDHTNGHHHRGRGGGGMWNLIVGTARRRHHAEIAEESNPFDFGLWQNCLGFFTEGRRGPLRGVNWYSFYEVESTRANLANPTLATARRM